MQGFPGYPGGPGEKGDKGAYGRPGLPGDKGERVSIVVQSQRGIQHKICNRLGKHRYARRAW